MTDGFSDFHVSETDGCSSLKKPQAGHPVGPACVAVVETRRVPTMSLETLFDSILPEGTVIDLLKIDAQGSGLDVVRSARRHLPKIRSVLLDALLDSDAPMYEGQNACSETMEAMREWGFDMGEAGALDAFRFGGDEAATTGGGAVCRRASHMRDLLTMEVHEVNLFFARPGRQGTPPGREAEGNGSAGHQRPACAHTLDGTGGTTHGYGAIEVEDALAVGAPGQLPTCRGAQSCATCPEGESQCFIRLSEGVCSCLHSGGSPVQP